MSNQIIVGLDIGTTKIACFVGQRDDTSRKVKILGFGKTESVGVAHGVVKNILSTADSIKRAVNQAANQADVDIEEVYVGIAGQHIKSMQNQGSIMIPGDHKYITAEDVVRLETDQKQIMLSPGEQIIHIFPQSYIVDGEPLNQDISPVGVAGKNLKGNFHIVTGNTVNITNIRDAVRLAGLHIKGVVLEPIASAYAVLDDRDRAAGVTLVDIGGGTTDIAVFQDGVIRHTSVLPVAGNAITNDIKEGCNIMGPQAETLKTRFGSCLPSEVSEDDIVSIPGIREQPAREIALHTLAGIIKARTESILEQVSYEIGQSGFDRKLIAGVVLTGGGAHLRCIREFASYITGKETRIGIPDEHLADDTPKELLHPMYATGIGLVLYGIQETENQEGRLNDPSGIGQTMDGREEEPQYEEKTEEEPAGSTDAVMEEHAKEETGVKTEEPHNKDHRQNGPKPRKLHSLGQSIKNYFGTIFNEPNIDPDSDE